MLNKEFKQYIYSRCDKTLTQDAKYKELQEKCVAADKEGNYKLFQDLSCSMESRVSELCYLQGFKDAIAIMIDNI